MPERGKKVYDVSITACADYSEKNVAEALVKALEPIGGLDFVKPGMKIAIKANLVSMMKPETAATTHPAMICALVKLLKERGADVVIGDSPGGLYTNAYLSGVYSATGMTLAEKAGAVLNRNFSEKTAQFEDAKVAKTFRYTAYLDDADAIISFSKLKSHGMMGMSAAVKNQFGTIPGTVKPEYHFRFPSYDDFADMLIDLNEYFKPVLSIIDAVEGMEGNGPTMGDPRHIGAVIASKSPYMADLVGAKLIGLTADEVPTLKHAAMRGLAPESADEISVCGNIDEFIVPDFKVIRQLRGMQFQGENNKHKLRSFALEKLLSSKPVVTKSECVGCRKCENICPAKAITMKNKVPSIDRSKCIKCFCCQEFCPKGAMKAKRPFVAKLLDHD